MIETLVGLIIGAGGTYFLMRERVKEYKQAFSIGFEAKTGSKPFEEEKKENEVFSSEKKVFVKEIIDKEREEIQENKIVSLKPERWDD